VTIEKQNMTEKKSNRLIHESSPYLLQHAYNPVDWYPWAEEALGKAIKEDKPILVSIGYSACHWCHVMERESFEDQQVAEFLNKHFISIKVDREEKPDVDQVYMDAVQAMGIQGGWPLNVFLTPEQKPFFGGTYFPKQSFYEILVNVQEAFSNKREKLDLSAEQLANHLSKSDVLKFGLTDQNFDIGLEELSDGLTEMSGKFDHNYGGFDKAPKFPMPSIWRFLLQYGHYSGDERYLKHSHFTLKQIIRGGIYDQVGGGFARYSVDNKWFLPHFEKMLYDNSQLLSLLAEAYSQTHDLEYKVAMEGTVNFLAEELMSEEGGFYSALDADSEGIEGKFYVWKAGEFKDTVVEDTDFWAGYFGIEETGNWENQENILTAHNSLTKIADQFKCTIDDATSRLEKVKQRLKEKRAGRIRPGLDDKRLAGWNGMALSGLADAYLVLQKGDLLKMALKNGEYIIRSHMEGNKVYRTPIIQKKPILGYLEDYAFVIQAFIKLYQASFDEKWIVRAKDLLIYTIENFFDDQEGFFFYTDKNTVQLIATKKEIFDNVIPSSNAIMAENLYLLGLLYDNDEFTDIAERMVNQMKKLITAEPEYASYWASLLLMVSQPMAEIAIIGHDLNEIRDKINVRYHPNKIFCGTRVSSQLPLLKERKNLKDNTIYVCFNKSCKLPVHSAEDALEQLK
jgi:uncharacterized protein YyaL (SSP411 family)